jgi:hypothetical protein
MHVPVTKDVADFVPQYTDSIKVGREKLRTDNEKTLARRIVGEKGRGNKAVGVNVANHERDEIR